VTGPPARGGPGSWAGTCQKHQISGSGPVPG